jgi:hypothetical protein
MRFYYPFVPSLPQRLNAWKRQEERVDLAWKGGHRVQFPGLRMAPRHLVMRHYLFLSVEHAVEKYLQRGGYVTSGLERGWHSWRARLDPERIALPRQSELRRYVSDDLLDRAEPWVKEVLADAVRDAVRAALAAPEH